MNLRPRIIQISGRKLTIDNAVVGIASYARFFAIPGLVAFGILLLYVKNRGKMKTRFLKLISVPAVVIIGKLNGGIK